MKNERKNGNAEVQRQISKMRDLYESIGMTIDFDTAVDLSLHLGKALNMVEQKDAKPQKKRQIM